MHWGSGMDGRRRRQRTDRQARCPQRPPARAETRHGAPGARRPDAYAWLRPRCVAPSGRRAARRTAVAAAGGSCGSALPFGREPEGGGGVWLQVPRRWRHWPLRWPRWKRCFVSGPPTACVMPTPRRPAPHDAPVGRRRLRPSRSATPRHAAGCSRCWSTANLRGAGPLAAGCGNCGTRQPRCRRAARRSATGST